MKPLVLAADSPMVQARRVKCADCPFLLRRFIAKLAQCGKCGCFILPKTRVIGEKCPVGRW